MNKILISFCFLLSISLFGQTDFTKNWVSHFSYSEIVSTDLSNGKLYVAANNSFFIYDVNTNERTEFSTINGLASEDIKIIRHVPSKNLIIVGFENGLVEIIEGETNKVMSLIDISNLKSIPPNNVFINDLFEDNGTLYIATGFGIVEYDLEKDIFKDTYFISNETTEISNTLSIGISGDFIYTTIEGRGTFKGNKNDKNLVLAENWSLVQAEEFNDFQIFQNQIIASDAKGIFLFNGTVFEEKYMDTSNVLDFTINEGTISISYPKKNVQLNSDFSTKDIIEYVDTDDNTFSNIYVVNNQFFYSEAGIGFLRGNTLSKLAGEQINPNGPVNNKIFGMDIYNGDIWLTYGDLNERFGFRGALSTNFGLSRFQNNQWKNFPFEEFNARRITNAYIDRQNKNKVYLSSFIDGLLIYENDVFTKFNSENSNIKKDLLGINSDFVFTTKTDSTNRLWIVNNFTENYVKTFSTNNNEIIVPTESILNLNFPDDNTRIHAWDLTFDNENLYIPAFRKGIIAYNTRNNQNGFIENIKIDNEIDPLFMQLRVLTIDKNGEMWIGYDGGLRLIEKPNNIFINPESVEVKPIIIEDNGVPQELLNDQLIRDIKVDAENNKWVATVGAGVFQFSPDGEETLNHFTTSNSPLPSNNVIKLGIDNISGNIFFATDKGLMEFKTNVVEAQEDFSEFKVFPNPVRPEYGDNVTVRIQGLTAGANVKITDIEGNLVYEAQNSTINGSGSGLIEWDTNSFSGNKVASGVYLILITSKDQSQTKISKLLIVR